MRPTVLLLALSLTAACLVSRPLAAQAATPIDRGRTLDARFAAEDASPGAGVSHTYVYTRRVRRGATLYVDVWGGFTELNTRLAPRVSISDPDAAADLSGTTRVEEYTDASLTASKTFDRPGTVVITVSSGAGAVGQGYAIRARDLAKRRSDTAGPHFAAGYGAVSLKMTGAGGEAEGEGLGLRVGAGLGGMLSVFAEGQAAEMSPRDPDAQEGAGRYTLYHADLGARLYLLGSGSRLRPYVQGAFGGRRITLAARPIEAQGLTLTPGGGVEIFLRPGFSVEGGARRSFGEITRWRPSGGSWRDIPDEYDLDVATTRLHLQVVVHL